MKLEKGKITFLIEREYTVIRLHDSKSGLTFIEVRITPQDTIDMLSRLGNVPCEITVMNNALNFLNKELEVKDLVFEISESEYKKYPKDIEALDLIANQNCPIGWTPDKYYGSQSSFFQKDSKYYAKVTIRRYV